MAFTERVKVPLDRSLPALESSDRTTTRIRVTVAGGLTTELTQESVVEHRLVPVDE
jgi:hypothetical protein